MKKISLLMFYSIIFLLFFIDVSAQQSIKKSTNNNEWVGRYEYTYVEGKTQGGAVPVVEHILDILEKGGSIFAHFTVDGYQAYDDCLLTAKASGNQLNLYFLKDLRSDDTPGTNRRLKSGQLIGTLVKTTLRGRTKYLFKSSIFFNRSHSPAFKKKG